MPAHSIALLVASVVAAVDWFAVWRGAATLERVAKPAVIVALLVVVATFPHGSAAFGERGGILGLALVAVALAASLIGDVLLLPAPRLVPGLAAFLVAQVAYTARFAVTPLGADGLPLAIAGALLVVLVAGRRILIGAYRQGLGLPVVVYLVAILAMAVAATCSWILVAAVGAWLFVVSDAILGWDLFVRRDRSPAADRRWRLADMVTYHMAQLLLVIGLLPY